MVEVAVHLSDRTIISFVPSGGSLLAMPSWLVARRASSARRAEERRLMIDAKQYRALADKEDWQAVHALLDEARENAVTSDDRSTEM